MNPALANPEATVTIFASAIPALINCSGAWFLRSSNNADPASPISKIIRLSSNASFVIVFANVFLKTILFLRYLSLFLRAYRNDTSLDFLGKKYLYP